MKLYIRCRLLCAVWCAIEILFFGGIIYGWGSLVFVLKEEGFYYEECLSVITPPAEQLYSTNITNTTIVNLRQNTILTPAVNDDDSDTRQWDGDNVYETDSGTVPPFRTCPRQESKLNLWFSVAVAFMYLSMAFLGELTTRLGTQVTRHIFTLTFVFGALCVAFATKDIPWLLCPGLCSIAVSGLVIFATNIQVANLFPRLQSTVVALYCGLFDSSSVMQQLMKIANENGISRRIFYVCLAGSGLIMLTISTVLFLPKSYITKQKIRRKSCELEIKSGRLLAEIKGFKHQRETDETSIRACILSPTYLVHVAWMSINTVTFVTFIGLVNVNLEQLSSNKQVISKYLGVFAYTTMCTVVAGLLAGMSYDCQRRRYHNYPLPVRVWRPVLLPMTMTGILGSMVYVLLLVGHLSVMVPTFVLFTLYRSFLYSIGVAFVNDAFPEQHFGALYGIMTFSTGLFSMLQYGFFSWFDAYEDANVHVTIFLLFLCLVTFIHPLQLGIRSFKKCTTDTNTEQAFLPPVTTDSEEGHILRKT
ncbi:solute carrier family 43 member 3-like [Mizuhopecten yessoensis]|uniref:Solute carrier family 43 member 3 n=1 Tax=Mizuhopecten yessoensis TaxID=6573 RepID=A0A210R5X7_MIZYE|nr:solute carrier family 43 member 3-like [Mizuhopecten yessoensis]OWF56336.1 Solute carrier family 43 member 3 [Mizuhopecten yessoensis]